MTRFGILRDKDTGRPILFLMHTQPLILIVFHSDNELRELINQCVSFLEEESAEQIDIPDYIKRAFGDKDNDIKRV